MENLDILRKKLEECDTVQKVIECKNIFIKQYLTPLYAKLKEVKDKKAFGLEINAFKLKINEIVDQKINVIVNLEDTYESVIDPNIEIDAFKLGKQHFISLTIDLIAEFFKKYNFEFINGEEITSTTYNFDHLNIGKDHVARDLHDTFFISEDILLRTHCTASTAKVLEHNNHHKDIRYFSYGNVYRKDDDDATHSHQFTQIDIVWLRQGFNLANLKYLINQLINYLFGDHLKTRYRLSYFPFTEPSFEVDVQCVNCLGDGCNVCKKSGWIEILGAGMLNQAVIKSANIEGIDTGLAAGIGVERIAMLKFGIKDIRDFYTNDFDFNKECKG